MIKERKYSANTDFKTGFFFKITFFLGMILLIIFLILKITSLTIDRNSTGILKEFYQISISTNLDTIGALSIVFIGLCIILYFFKKQFNKLAEIAEEIEKEYHENK